MPVYKLMHEMPYEELVGWFVYFKARPLGWQDDQRTYMLLAAQGTKKKPEELFPSLAAIKAATKSEITPVDSLKSSGFLDMLKAAARKNNVDWNLDDQVKLQGDGAVSEQSVA